MPESTLEDRLHADARRTIDPPDLDVVLADARSAPAPAHRHRTSTWLAAAATVVVVAGGATALRWAGTSTNGHTRAASSGPATPRRFVSHITGVVLLPNDPSGRSLVVYANAPGKRMSGYGCVDTTKLKIGQLGPRVSLRPTARLRSHGRVSCESAAYRDPRTGESFAGLMVRLDRPLGTRAVVDETTGEPVAVFRPSVAHPDYLPHGYAPQDKKDAVQSTSFWYDERPGFLSPIAVSTEYKAKGRKPRLGIINAPTETVTAGGKVLEHVLIDGRDATVTDSPHARCVTWSPDGRTGRQVCSYNAVVNPLGDYQKGVVQLDVGQLVKVARNLS